MNQISILGLAVAFFATDSEMGFDMFDSQSLSSVS
jgi:hypothetical protein